MTVDAAWLRAEAERLGLALSDADLTAMRSMLEKTRAALAAARPEEADDANPVPRHDPERRDAPEGA